MIFPLPTRFLRTLGALLPAAVLLPLLPAEEAPTGQWKEEVQVNGTAYLPLESLRSFYKLSPMVADRGTNAVVVGNSGISITFHRGSCEAVIGGYRVRLAHPTQEAANGDLLISKADAVKLFDPILRPTYISPRRVVRTVVLDPGRGGHDISAQKSQVREADLTLLLANKLKKELTDKGYTVLLTREQNHPVSDSRRVDTVRQADAPIFISLNVNHGRSDTKGIETYALQPAEQTAPSLPGNGTDEANIALAFSLHCALVSTTGAEDGACRRAKYSLLNSVTCPSALVQVGYATHADEATALNSEEYQNKLVQGIVSGICTFAQALNPDSKVPVATAPVDNTPPTPYRADAPVPQQSTSTSNKGRNTARNTGTRNNNSRNTNTRNTTRSNTRNNNTRGTTAQPRRR